MARKEAEETREKLLKDREERLKEINNSLRMKNLCLIGVPVGTKKDRDPESIFRKNHS